MTKTLKRIGVIALVLAMVFSLSAVAFAVNTNGELNTDKGIESTDNTIGIAKQIVFVNGEDTTVREPNITYTYTIATTAPGTATVKDKNSVSSTVKAGPIEAVTSTTATVAFADTATAPATSAGNAVTKYAEFSFTAATFGAPGIYRYKISESTNVTKASVGITEAAIFNADRFLDVYVHWNTGRTALEIYGYVLFEGSETTSITSPTVNMKSSGYVNTSATASEQTDVDVYTTQNVYINKTTTGGMADKGHDFPIHVTLTAPSGVSAVKMDVTKTGSGALTTSNDSVGDYVNTWSTAIDGTVRDGSQIAIKGIPAGATISIVEDNDTPDSYKVKAGTTANGVDLLAEAIVDAGSSATATSAVTLDAKKEIFFTNTLEEISPTGVVMRVAPYAAMGGAGCLLFVLSKRSKREEEDA